MEKRPGVYKFTCLVNNKNYIGSSVNVYKRVNEHLNMLRKQKHPNPHFQRTFNKYGEESFKYDVLEYCPKELRFKKEQFWIDTTENLLNCSKEVVYNKGKSLPKEVRDKISKKLKGRKLSKEHLKNLKERGKTFGQRVKKHTSRRTMVFTENHIYFFDSASDAARYFNLDRNKVSKRLSGRLKNNLEYKFYYV